MSGKIAVIGGSGLYQIDGVTKVKEHNIETPFGKTSGAIAECLVGETECFFLPRHGETHSILPHEVNYRANIYALKSLGVKYILSISAVGSLTQGLAPRRLFLPDQFIDWTKGKRERTFFGEGVIAHVSVAEPIDQKFHNVLKEQCSKLGLDFEAGGSYVCIEGPQFSSKAESEMYRSFGAKVIGMTNVPESYLAKEAGIAYATVAMVTDYDCWKEEHCTVEEIMKVMKDNNLTANKLIREFIPHLSNHKFEFDHELKKGLMTPVESLSGEKQEWVKTLLH
ncbi:MAG: S-methyl-5'-thioadenosine phosphorylase [Bacteriovoracaceae bacterium]